MKTGITSFGFLSYDLLTVVPFLSKTGYDGIEMIYYPESWERHVPSPKALSECCDDHGLEICAFRFIAGGDTGPNLDELIDIAVSLGAPLIDVKIVGPEENEAGDVDFEHTASLLRSVHDQAADRGMQVVLETHPGVVHSSCRSAIRLIELAERSAVRVNYDQANLAYAGKEDIETAISLLAGSIGYVHLKNGRFGRDRAVWTLLGGGDIDNLLLLKGLSENGYDGYLTVELPGGGEPFTRAEEDLRYLMRLHSIAETL